MTVDEFNDLFLAFLDVQTKPMSCVNDILATLQEGKDYEFVREQEHPWMEPEFKEDTKVMLRIYKFYVDGEEKPEYMTFLYGNNTNILGIVDGWEYNIQQPWDY